MSVAAESSQTPVHVSVLVDEVLVYLAPRPGAVIVDATVGEGGHAEAILRRIAPAGRLIGVDRDAEAIRLARLDAAAHVADPLFVDVPIEWMLSDERIEQLRKEVRRRLKPARARASRSRCSTRRCCSPAATSANGPRRPLPPSGRASSPRS